MSNIIFTYVYLSINLEWNNGLTYDFCQHNERIASLGEKNRGKLWGEKM